MYRPPHFQTPHSHQYLFLGTVPTWVPRIPHPAGEKMFSWTGATHLGMFYGEEVCLERDEMETRLEVLLAPGVVREHADVMDAAAALAHGTALNFINPAASRSAHSFLELAHKAIRDTKAPSGSDRDTSNITNLIAIATSPGQVLPTVVTTPRPRVTDTKALLDEIFEVGVTSSAVAVTESEDAGE